MEITDFYSVHLQTQQCMKLGKKPDGSFECSKTATLYFYGFTRNTIKETMKMLFWHCLEELQVDCFSLMTTMDNGQDTTSGLNFVDDDGSFHWYLVNYSLGENTIKPNEIGALLL